MRRISLGPYGGSTSLPMDTASGCPLDMCPGHIFQGPCEWGYRWTGTLAGQFCPYSLWSAPRYEAYGTEHSQVGSQSSQSCHKQCCQLPGLEESLTVSRVALVAAESSRCSFFPASTALRCFRTSLWVTQWNRRTKRPWREMGIRSA